MTQCFQWEEDSIFGNEDSKPAEEGFLEFILPMLAANEASKALAPKPAETPPPAAPAPAPSGGGVNIGDIAALIAAIRGTDPRPAPTGGGSGGDPVTGALVGSLAARGLSPSISTSGLQAALGSIASPGTDESRLARLAGQAARDVEQTIGPQLSRVRDMLDLQQTQTTATSEHRGLVSRDQYRQAVLDRLDRLERGQTVRQAAPGQASSISRAFRVTLR